MNCNETSTSLYFRGKCTFTRTTYLYTVVVLLLFAEQAEDTQRGTFHLKIHLFATLGRAVVDICRVNYRGQYTKPEDFIHSIHTNTVVA